MVPTTAAIGLTSTDAAQRLASAGPNVIPRARPPSPLRRLLAEFVHFFALMLWVAGALAFLAGLPQLGVAIFVVIIVNGLFAFAQERRAEHATERLRDLMPARATVRRDGVAHVVDAADVVVGDVVLLAPGDRIVADLEVVEQHGLQLDESMLTGESLPVRPEVGAAAAAGTFVVEGEGAGVVTATGAATRLAGIAALTASTHRPRSPLATELDRVVRAIAVLAVGVGAAFFGLAVLLGTEPRDGFLFAVGVTVALVPEGLLPTVTLSLARGAKRMAGQNALVRHLEAVETLGATTFVCTDKTGTLTRNEMTVVEVWTPAGTVAVKGPGYAPSAAVDGPDDAVRRAVLAAEAARASSWGRAVERDGGWVAQGDPMEAAIDALARRLGGPSVSPAVVERRIAFDPVRRRASVATADWLLCKGAPDSVLPRCGPDSNAAEEVDRLAARGLRVLAVARRRAVDVPADASGDDAERDMELLGLLALQDPPRDDVPDAIVACRRAGVRLAMVTGDHPATARAIAAQVGLLGPDEMVLRGDELPDDERELGELLDHDGVVVSRVAPEDKLRIARALQARGHVVAMTGDGVNDGPALREADIGVAMGRSGTDVAREAADLVLLDDHFATIVRAIEQGRASFTNIRRFLTYHLTDNVAELTPFVVWALSGGNIPLALGVLQILCLDIGTDLVPALALGGEAPTERALTTPPNGRHLIDGKVLRRVFGVLGPTEALVEMLAFFTVFLVAGWRPGQSFPAGDTLLAASGAAFAAVIIGQAANAFACRSATRPPWQLGWTTNHLLVTGVILDFVALLGFLYVEPIADVLEHAPPPTAGFLVAVLAAPAVLAADAAHKARRASRSRRHPPPAGPDAGPVDQPSTYQAQP